MIIKSEIYNKIIFKIYSAYLNLSNNNSDFLNNISDINFLKYLAETNENDIWDKPKKNTDLEISHARSSILVEDYNELENKYKNGNLVTIRPGCVEVSFILKYYFKMENFYYHQDIPVDNVDIYMKKQTGLYYKNNNRKKEVLDWWCKNTLEYIKKKKTTLTGCVSVQYWDLILFSYLNVKNKKIYNYGDIWKIILKNSGGKKILYIGSAVKSIKAAYNRGVQKAWNFKVPEFDLYCVQTPQTTLGMPYPDDSIIETTQKIVDQIVNNYSDFDTAILGCGAYGPPIMNMLSDKFSSKNILYLGSDCYKMFGIYSSGMPTTHIGDDGNLENWIEVLEEYNDSYECIDNGKYWSKRQNPEPFVEKQDKSKKNKLFYYLLLIFLLIIIKKKKIT